MPDDMIATRPDSYLKANMPVYLLRSLVKALDDLQVPRGRLMLGLGFGVDDLNDPACRVSFRQGREMICRAQKMAPGLALGLETGRRETLHSIGLVGYAMTTCATAGEAIALALELQRETGSMLEFTRTENTGTVTLTADSRHPDPAIQMFLYEEAFASFIQIARDLLGEDCKPVRVDFPYPEPRHAAQCREIFGCEVRFGQMAGRFCFDARWDRLPLSTADELNHRQIMTFLEQGRSRQMQNEEIIETVERHLRQKLDAQVGITEVAGALCMSERTLRRRLSECGVSFSSLQDRLRSDRARELLVNRDLTIEQIAYAVGFSDPHNFHRAFRRWTGKTPGTLRREILTAWPT